MPVITATVSAVAHTDIGKKIKDGIDQFSEGMPVLLNALDELKAVHPFIGGELIQELASMQIDREGSCCSGIQDGLHTGAKASRQR
jgi:hypothetical protein